MRFFSGVMVLILLISSVSFAQAFSHADTVSLRRDPAMDQTSLYAFRSDSEEDRVVIAGSYFPFASSQTDFFHALPDPDGLYAFHIDQDGDAVEDVTYAVRFRQLRWRQEQVMFGMEPEEENSIDEDEISDDGANELQSSDIDLSPSEDIQEFVGYPYRFIADVYRIEGEFDGRTRRRDLYLRSQSVSIGAQGIQINDHDGKGLFFFGHRDDPDFFGTGMNRLEFLSPTDQLERMNVFSIVMELPLDLVQGEHSVIGVWGATYRMAVRQMKNGMTRSRGNWQQVSRMGMPWVNHLYVPYSKKHQYNAQHPSADEEWLSQYFTLPLLMSVLAEKVGLDIPLQGRKDIYEIYMNGIPDVNQFRSGVPAEMLRLNVSLRPSERPSRMGVLGGDFGGFPNGRRLTDDATDISFQIMGGMLLKTFGISFENTSQLLLLGDRVTSNDRDFEPDFPYLAAPHL
ncbi:MAG: DUF4331 domain-containing protein [Candidatus Gracilibacteria bacterium]|nr:DUF4331 domain-containing protein [Candidatus Gracilibacteria bacterium]